MADQPPTLFIRLHAGLLDALPTPAALVDTYGRFVYRNAAHRLHVRWRQDPLPVFSRGDGAPADALPKQRGAAFRRAVETGQAQVQSETLQAMGGALLRYQWLCLPLIGPNDRVEQLLILELEETGNPDEASRPDVQARVLGELVQEIRSPLAAIVGLADSLARQARPEQAHLANLILHSTEQLIECLDSKVKPTRRAPARPHPLANPDKTPY